MSVIIPDVAAPKGSSYQWVVISVLGDTSFAQVEEMEATGWRKVPRSRHPAVAVHSKDPDWLVCGGQILMERPQYLTDRARQWEHAKAMTLASARPGQAPRSIIMPKRRTNPREWASRTWWRFKWWWKHGRWE